MANSILTSSMITREAIRLFINTNAFIQSIDRQYDDQFARTGAKIGTNLRIRLPNDYVVRRGAAASPQDTTEQQTTLTVASQAGIDVSFSSLDRTMSLDDFSTRVLKPMLNNLGGDVARDVISGTEVISNMAANTDGGGVVQTPTTNTWLVAGALLDGLSCPRGDRNIVLDPFTQARTVESMKGLFNPTGVISEQFKSGVIGHALGFDWMMDQSVVKHTTGAYSGSLTVNGAGQTGTTLVTNAITGGLKAGDIITLAGVYSVNRVTKESNGVLAQFVVLADVPNGGTSVSIYPAIIPPATLGDGSTAKVQYQTVTASPANSAVISVVTLASSIHRKNFAYHKSAVTMVTADLVRPTRGVEECHVENYDGISMRFLSAYIPGTDQFLSRLDVLYGYKWLRPEWAVAVPDAL